MFQRIFGIYPKENKLKALEALRQVDILDKAYNRADQLSGGQQQRVALARTLAQSPDIILADEPVASLDPITATQVMDYFTKINREQNIAILINIHHVDLALDYATRVIGIKDGVIVYDGPADKVDNDVLKNIYGEKLSEIELNDVEIKNDETVEEVIDDVILNENKEENTNEGLSLIHI